MALPFACSSLLKTLRFAAFSLVAFACIAAQARVRNADPKTVGALLPTLSAGDTLILAPGIYPHLNLKDLHGKPDAWITVTGADSPGGIHATILTNDPCCNTVEIVNSWYLAIKKLRIDGGGGIHSRFGISATGGTRNLVHDILIENNVLVGMHASQQNDGISTKVPTWNWTIRGNKIFGAGTGIYLGNSDGTDPFIGGIIENNLVQDPIGYDMEIKYQKARPDIPGMPTGVSTTIIRNNTFIKSDGPSPDGDRPNVLVGGFPDSGPGSSDLYQIYGNFFYHNPRESLLQASGRVSIHDNVFVGGDMAAITLRDQDLRLMLARVYNNTIYSPHRGIVADPIQKASVDVIGNLVFADIPISGKISHLAKNLTDSFSRASFYVDSPSLELGMMSFYPLPEATEDHPIDLSQFSSDLDYNLDFNGLRKGLVSGKNVYTGASKTNVFPGAYAGEGTNPGWKLQAGIKPRSGNDRK